MLVYILVLASPSALLRGNTILCAQRLRIGKESRVLQGMKQYFCEVFKIPGYIIKRPFEAKRKQPDSVGYKKSERFLAGSDCAQHEMRVLPGGLLRCKEPTEYGFFLRMSV